MSEINLETNLRYHGISPWEIEVMYGYLNARFSISQEEIIPEDEDFVSFLEWDIPLAFNDEFFKWFEFKRWEQIKAVFKEMKRRRGSGNAIKIIINFFGNPKISFVLDTEEKQWYDNAIDKIDFVLELLPYHLNPDKLPSDVTELIYKFDPKSIRWRLNFANSKEKKYTFRGDVWISIN
ncbi:MAG: hypothetical protein OEL77_06895 [Nitrosopumilus sp.]|nr:hypothetical protein [Nitrosopumilus sp.]MDH3385722.1 hypothetical protein [Nitrosopumilus sp.]